MTIDFFRTLWSGYSFPEINSFLQKDTNQALFSGLSGSSDAFLITDLFLKSKKPIMVFVESSKQAELLVEECQSFLDEESVVLFPSRDAVPYNLKSPFGPTVEARLNVLTQLLYGKKKIIIAPYSTLLQKIITRKDLFKRTIRLHCNEEVSIDKLCTWLTDIGFQRENQVTDIGMFSIRGSIVDIYPFLHENPIRLDFWGNTIDSIREFDVFSQKSLAQHTSVTIVPMKEFYCSSSKIDDAISSIEQYGNAAKTTETTSGIEKLRHQWCIGDHEGIEWFSHWFDTESASILDYLSHDTILVWNDLLPLERRIDDALANYRRHLSRIPAVFLPLISTPEQLLFSKTDITESCSFFNLIYINTVDTPQNIPVYAVHFLRQPQLPKELKALSDNLHYHNQNNFRCILVSPNSGHGERMSELLKETCPFLEIVQGFITHGFIDQFNKIALFSESQVISKSFHPTRTKKRSTALPISGFDALVPQDYVVHEDHGIARFIGVEHITTGESKHDCMVLLYADGAKVYVPVEDFYKVQKYIGKDSDSPTLSKIGTASWDKLKNRTRESLKEMASELIELYAKRQYLEGIRYEPDNLWQKEFEDAFIFDETPDQLRAVKEIKEDMESTKPMDRLVCGDVGFGKTEVAMRTAFKAIMSGYQVAILAPTTILAAQHFATFSERMTNFPVKIAVLSRFVKNSDQKQVIEQIKEGNVDLLIGTHRILSDDIVYKNLGLLIIDEEQRFGVRHKEKLKQLRYKVDVLSLSATPIPRTLHMSLIGTRDLSIINTPPRNRLPIETHVTPYHEEQVKNAIENEIERGGQVFFVSNRIKSLNLLQDRLEQLIPKARVISAHGQMDEKQLERIMKEFIAGRYDVLLSTVIIENGLDIPNVNTIIVNRADTMGLSQLYQLRGRVGRSSEQAFAYFFTPSFKELSDISLKRLKALEQYTDLGSGFQIAMRDLEIRGAGNILGTRQHGFIAAVGFELYCRLLKDAVEEMQGKLPVVKNIDTKMDIPLSAYIPTDYISDGTSRIAIYQELSSVHSLEEICTLEKSVSDRFGPLPNSVIALVVLIKIKTVAGTYNISRISIAKTDEVIFYFDGDEQCIKETISLFIRSTQQQCNITNSLPFSLRTKLVASQPLNQCLETLQLLQSLSSEHQTATTAIS